MSKQFKVPLTLLILCLLGGAIVWVDASFVPRVQSQLALEGIDATYGMPTFDFYDENGTIVAQTIATAVASDGSWVTGNTPYMDTSSFYGGTYTIGVNNNMPDGTSNPVGYASVWLSNSNPPPPPPDPDPCLNQDPRWEQMPCNTY